MKYDFTNTANELIEVYEKRLTSIKKKIDKTISDYLTFIKMNVDVRQSMEQEIDDVLNDEANKQILLFTETMNKIQRIMGTYLATER